MKDFAGKTAFVMADAGGIGRVLDAVERGS